MTFKVLLKETGTLGYVAVEDYFIKTIASKLGSDVVLELYLKTVLSADDLYLGSVYLNGVAEYCGMSVEDDSDYKMLIDFTAEFICSHFGNYANIIEELDDETTDATRDLKKYVRTRFESILARKELEAMRKKRIK